MGIWKLGCIAVSLWLATFAGQVRAQVQEVEVVLTNGDRLKGELVSEGESIVLKHAVLGELSMGNGDVRMIERPKPQPASPKQRVQKPAVAKTTPSLSLRGRRVLLPSSLAGLIGPFNNAR